ncbi:DUF4241 domain-containing protein [Priestia megaterium]|uniref:DUF4241 domain-containing protein n=1 Tax=Priestia megaterium TaxID=1404 RepID=UPI00237AE723|nr:DUF4241 domain-containing protein [Priestia megaterium]MDD9791783.1 DUF4241 domain-containing protein [Priestia megaterium]
MNKKILGSFEVKGNQLIVSDPCYPVEGAFDESDILSWVLEPAKSGEWKASIFEGQDVSVSKLIACHIDFEPNSEWIELGKEIGVDSAMAGIFDASVFGRDEAIPYDVKNIYDIEMDEEGLKYYVACADIVASSDYEAGIVAGGIVSMSGIGDGYYPVFVQYNDKDEIIAVLLEFYIEDEEE